MSCLLVFIEKVPVKSNFCSKRRQFFMDYSSDIYSTGWWLSEHFYQAVDEDPFFENWPTNWRK